MYSRKILCSYFLRDELNAFNWQLDSESRNQATQGTFKENKLSGEINSQLTFCKTVTDAGHVGKARGRVLQLGFFMLMEKGQI